jgi:hypothetical protein
LRRGKFDKNSLLIIIYSHFISVKFCLYSLSWLTYRIIQNLSFQLFHLLEDDGMGIPTAAID